MNSMRINGENELQAKNTIRNIFIRMADERATDRPYVRCACNEMCQHLIHIATLLYNVPVHVYVGRRVYIYRERER